MRTILITISSLFLFSFGNINATQAQEKQRKIEKATFTVDGVCNQCKKRIEDAALIKGVRSSNWDKESQTLEVYYRTKYTNQEEIEKAISQQGHSTENMEADSAAYENLPPCCAYRTVEAH